VERDLRALKFSSREIAFITNLIQIHMHDAGPNSTPRAIRKLLAKLDAHRLDHLTFLRLRLADHKGNLAKPGKRLAEVRALLEKMEAVLFSGNRQQEFNRSMLAVNGTDLIQTFSLRPGKEVGRLLNALFEHVLDHPEHNDRQMLLVRAADLLGRVREVTPDNPPDLPGFPELRTDATPTP
jgi:tRNA nucleotidyltransferase (CCA-adding enzyme)